MPRPIACHIDLQALQHNLQCLQTRAGAAQVFAVVKANAYGHGIARLYPVLQHAPGIATLDFAEAQLLRELGYTKPILMLEGVFEPRDLELCSRFHLWHCIHHQAQLDWLAASKAAALRPHTVFLKFNSGMHRLGFAPAHYAAAWQRLQQLTQVEQVLHMSHFAMGESVADSAHARATIAQTIAGLDGPSSFCNSAALLCQAEQHPELFGDWVRMGIALYGASPDAPTHTAAHWGLRPVMSLCSQIIAVQSLAAGAQVGYGATYTAPHAQRLGIVACGYADGYPRHAPSGTPVLVDGYLCPTLGRVSMDMLAVDLSAVPQADVGSAVTLWGTSADKQHLLPVETVAHAAQTIAYELLCALAARVPVHVHPL